MKMIRSFLPVGQGAFYCERFKLNSGDKDFINVVNEIREENIFTFPVLSASLLYQDGKFVDQEFARWCSDHNCQ